MPHVKEGLGAFIVRVALGFTFFIHGCLKFQGGIENAAAFFETLGLPGILADAVGVIELVGGFCVMLGIGARTVSAAFALIMLGAIFTAKRSAGFAGGYELEVALLAMSVHTILSPNPIFAVGNLLTKAEATGREV
ncbi:Putative oxidoreductase CatD [Paenibacillus konkukensis]|uniref:Oxidoreductase CatD n=1 Tax=Paenibacillus konkukensis TaxID=2020716 RepID=A0ABY4RUR2_9BACL|nr:DoxX family protein [Paenibacillus konkukensis]UQZ86341.1 Putative oxidoreductase CatD [Paenibacillus konkukensis]